MPAENHFAARIRIEAPAERIFQWHAVPGALERLTPPWEQLEIVQRAPGIRDGDRGTLRVHIGPFPMLWVFEHCDFIQDRQFRDVQISGPFRRWEHTHLFIPDGLGACILEDHIIYELQFGWPGNFLGGWFVRRKLQKLFAYRHRITADAMAHSAVSALLADKNPINPWN